ncbi:MAG: sulfite exporter TauE/SafE family protein [Thaumarchaeota archaeon]|nr:sulfite exporter TauE/SafE family protein [Candidatus Calditenuaceae archaeon]MDW8043967.1 sulfite exporter TauE/SafE family protein [Nitrososphaerota archaeon]
MVDVLEVIAISFASGLLGALTGLGGASITTPVLVMLGVPVKHAIASGILSVIATSSGTSSAYLRDRVTNVRVAMFLETFAIVGGTLGAVVTVAISPRLVAVAFSGVIASSALAMKLMAGGLRTAPASQDRLSRWLGLEGEYLDPSEGRVVRYRITNALYGGIGMIGAGMVAGMLGIGAGAFKVAIHELVLRMPPKVSTTTSNLIMGMTALAGAGVYLSSGLMVMELAVPLALGTAIGSIAGSRLLLKLRDERVKLIYFAVAAIASALMLYRALFLGE